MTFFHYILFQHLVHYIENSAGFVSVVGELKVYVYYPFETFEHLAECQALNDNI